MTRISGSRGRDVDDDDVDNHCNSRCSSSSSSTAGAEARRSSRSRRGAEAGAKEVIGGCRTASRRRQRHQQHENIKCIASGWRACFRLRLGIGFSDWAWGGVRQWATCTWQHAHTHTHRVHTDRQTNARWQRKCCRYLCDKRKTQAAVAWDEEEEEEQEA